MFVSTPFLSQIHATSWLCNQGAPLLHLVTCPPQPLPCYNLLLCSLFPHRWVNSTEYLMGHIGFQIPPLRHSIFFARPNLPQILGPPAAFPVNFQVARGRRRSEQPADWRMMEDHRYQQNSPIYSYIIYNHCWNSPANMDSSIF